MPQDAPRKLGYPGPDQLDAFLCVEPLSVPDGYGTVAEWQYARTRTNKPLISTLQSPVTQAFRVDPGKVYKNKGEVAWALVPYINKELKEVVAAGCTHVQFDEPAYWILPGGVAEMVDIFNTCVEGVNTTVGFHLCFGIPAAGPRPRIAASPCSRRTSRICCRRAPHRVRQSQHVRGGVWQKYGGDKVLCAGVINVKGRGLEPVEVVTDRIRTCLRYCPPEKLWVRPIAAFSQTVRWLAVEKMKVMVAAAKLVREEVG